MVAVGCEKWLVVLLMLVELLFKANPHLKHRIKNLPRYMEIYGLVWNKHNTVLVLIQLLGSQCIEHKAYHIHYCEDISLTNMFCRIFAATNPFSCFAFTIMFKYYFIQRNYKDWFNLQRTIYYDCFHLFQPLSNKVFSCTLMWFFYPPTNPKGDNILWLLSSFPAIVQQGFHMHLEVILLSSYKP